MSDPINPVVSNQGGNAAPTGHGLFQQIMGNKPAGDGGGEKLLSIIKDGAAPATTAAPPPGSSDAGAGPAADKKDAPPDAKFAEAYAEIARRDNTLRKQQIAIERQQKELEATFGPLKDLAKLAKEDPQEALRRLGSSPEALLLAQLGRKPEAKKPEELIAELQARLDRQDQERTESQKKADQERIDQQIAWSRNNIKAQIDQSDKYPLVKALGKHGEVADAMAYYLEEFGELPSVDEIAAAAEEKEQERYLATADTPAIKEALMKKLGLAPGTPAGGKTPQGQAASNGSIGDNTAADRLLSTIADDSGRLQIASSRSAPKTEPKTESGNKKPQGHLTLDQKLNQYLAGG